MRTTPVSHQQAMDVLFGAYRRQILALLLLRPDETFFVREIARLTGASAGSLHRELKLLTECGLLVRSTSGNQVRYQAAQDSPIYDELAGIFRKTSGMADVLHELLSPVQAKIKLAFVFGSVAQGKAKSGSDIDLLVIGTAAFAKVVELCHAGSVRLGREVNPVVMTRAAFESKRLQKDRFVSRIVAEPKIFVMGDASEFAKLAQDRPT